jgi:hypothetical protein
MVVWLPWATGQLAGWLVIHVLFLSYSLGKRSVFKLSPVIAFLKTE